MVQGAGAAAGLKGMTGVCGWAVRLGERRPIAKESKEFATDVIPSALAVPRLGTLTDFFECDAY
ncbi:hypothetical protein GCM10009628_16880 [Paeniglutamicibacter kerguelensis]